MKKHLFLMYSILPMITFSQVGINTESPKASLDVVASTEATRKPDGIIAPNLTGKQLKTKDESYTINQTGAIVYVTEGLDEKERTTKTIKVAEPSYYYFDGAIWQRFYSSKQQESWFYMPSFNLDISSIGQKTVNLYQEYSKQFTKTGNDKFISNNPNAIDITTSTNKIYQANELDYIVTEFDKKYIDTISIDNQGVMTYTVKDTNPPANSFINIILTPKK